jgi:MFS family permease
VCNSLLVQRSTADEMRGRVFTVIMAVNYSFLGLGYVVAGPLVDHVGPRWVFGSVGILLGIAALIAWALTRSMPREVERRAAAEAT